MAIPLRHALALAALALALPVSAHAEPTLLLRWPDIVALVDQHPRLAEAASRHEAAAAGIRAAAQIPNPSLEASAAYAKSPETSQGRAEWGLALDIPLDWLARRGPQVDAATASARATLQDAKALRLEVLLALRAHTWTLIYDQARLASLEATEAQLVMLVALVGKRVEKGEARPIELPRVETELEKVRNELEAARSNARTHRAQLRLWLPGLTSEFSVEPDFGQPPAVPELEAALQRIRAEHPAVLAASAQADARRAEALFERRQRIPAFALRGFHESELDRQSWGGALTVDVPLWNWSSGRIAQAEALVAAEEHRRDAALRELLGEVIAVHGRCTESLAVAARFRQQILPRAEQAVSTLEKTFQAGETSLLEVIDTRRVLGDARRDGLAAALQSRLECSRLLAFLGEVP